MWARQGRAGLAECRPHPRHTSKPRKAVRGRNFLTRSVPPPGKSGGFRAPPTPPSRPLPQLWASAHPAQSALPGCLHCYSWLSFLGSLAPSLPPPHICTPRPWSSSLPQAPSYLSTQITKGLRLWLPPTASVSPSAGLADWGSLGRRRRRPWSSTRPGSHPSPSGCQRKPDMK